MWEAVLIAGAFLYLFTFIGLSQYIRTRAATEESTGLCTT